MKLISTEIKGVMIAETSFSWDSRGVFARFFCETDLAPALGGRRIVQINYSYSRYAGAIRGMHYQHRPHAEMKMVRCLKGRIWDVAVDLREGSETFMKWHSEELSPENGRMLVIPEGCAHGFQTLNENSELLYLHTSAYAPDAEGAVRYDDPLLAINWPLPVTEISPRDQQLTLINSEFKGLS